MSDETVLREGKDREKVDRKLLIRGITRNVYAIRWRRMESPIL